MSKDKPETFEEVDTLVQMGAIEVMLQEDVKCLADGKYKTHFLICDHRRTVEEGEVYEVIV